MAVNEELSSVKDTCLLSGVIAERVTRGKWLC